MVKISVGGYDDGEGSSNSTQKRRRIEQEQQLGYEIGESSTRTEGEEDEEEEEVVEEMEEEEEERQGQNGDGTAKHTPAGDETVGSDANRGQNRGSATDDKGRSVSVTITDSDVLDCCICYEPLFAPVFQCENGHIACCNCCARLGNKCPMCSMPIGYNRCRAIEKVLESIKMSCMNAKYGCKETFNYSRKNDHEEKCFYLPCSCPYSGCDFVASSEALSHHFGRRHLGSGIQFIYDKFFTVFLNIGDKAVILQEKYDANLFIVHNDHELVGNLVHITCIGPKSKAGFRYDMLASSQGSTLKLQSFTRIIQGHSSDAATTGLLLIPCGFYGSGQIKLDIRIKGRRLTLAGD